ncbi:uncharacterized protein JN550_000588 [Neoarthrinium moseri]|uniref:uncharacterized protein n=1 Tax=Neoarthrinium moseri TaxID=1658444 RepID=UPI001FDCCDD9|nr:uncharacterized protein JN550_000588 [Neoarthrinium moseri]KAI1878406.1 hypothetical protein JN550_000588 [Neoarthrinium moseri]
MHRPLCSRTLPVPVVCLLSFWFNGAVASLDGLCPPLGPVLPAPKEPSSNLNVQAALKLFKESVHNVTGSFNKSAVSIGVQSIHESAPMFEYHFTPPELDPRGVNKVDSNTVYRLASTSKLFPVLSVLKTEGMDLNDPITKYIPDLRSLNEHAREESPLWTVDWDDMTLGSLASHLGAPADLPMDLTTDQEIDWTEIGFPSIEDSLHLNCSLLGDPPCDRTVFWKLFGYRPPVFPPFTTSVYSNVGFALLGWAVESVTKTRFSDHVRNTIWEPTGMDHTFDSKPDDSLGFIPVNSKWWDATIGYEKAAGDYYSCLSDMIAFGISILKNQQLSPVKTRRWLKPVVSTSASNLLLGTPWEIYRFTNDTVDGRLIEIYTKMGNLFHYNSILVLIPDYGIVIDVLAAGPETSGGTLLEIITSAIKLLIPAFEDAAKDEARIAYAGTYTDTDSESSITLSLDDDGPGIKVSNWKVRGSDVFKSFAKVQTAFTHGKPPEDETVRFRMYPTGLETETQSSWRGVWTIGTPEELAEAESQFIWPMATCNTWAQLDRTQYGLQSQDHFIFTVKEVEAGKKAVSVEFPAYRVTLERQSSSMYTTHGEDSQKPLSHA